MDEDANYVLERNDSWNVWVDVVQFCVIFAQIIYQIVPHASHFLSIELFSSVTLKTVASSSSEMYCIHPIKMKFSTPKNSNQNSPLLIVNIILLGRTATIGIRILLPRLFYENCVVIVCIKLKDNVETNKQKNNQCLLWEIFK